MKAGFSERHITLALGMEMPGDYYKQYITGIHDPLKVRAAVIDDGQQRVALVGVDTCVIQPGRLVAEAREVIERTCGIPGDHVLIAASHTHSGGPLFGLLPGDVEEAPELVRELALHHSVAIDPSYCDSVLGQICAAVCEADAHREDALLSVGSGCEDQVSFNRRFRMRNGRTYTHPGKLNPDIVEPAGPVDPEVGVVAAWNAAGDLLGCAVNFACHGTTLGGTAVSADWIYYLEKTIRGAMDTNAPVVFLNGACGDITQVNNLSANPPEFGERYARLVGTRVGAEAVKVMAVARRGELAPVTAACVLLNIKRRRPDTARLEGSRRLVEERLAAGHTQGTDWVFAKELVILDYLAQTRPIVSVEVQAVQIGPAVFLGNPAEFFCQSGLDIKRGSRFPFTYVVELANGAIGYTPPEDAFAPSGGGYETVLTSYSNLETSAAGSIVESSLGLAADLQPGAVPEESAGAAPGEAWDYGMLGPDS